MFLTIIIAVKGQQKMYHGLWSHYCMFPVFKLITVMFIQKIFSPFLLLWGSRTERSVKTSFPSFFFFLLNLCWRCECLCLCHDFLLPALMYWQIYHMPVIFFHPVFHGFIYCNVKQKKKSFEYWRSCTDTKNWSWGTTTCGKFDSCSVFSDYSTWSCDTCYMCFHLFVYMKL